jgi:hypothetical protein
VGKIGTSPSPRPATGLGQFESLLPSANCRFPGELSFVEAGSDAAPNSFFCLVSSVIFLSSLGIRVRWHIVHRGRLRDNDPYAFDNAAFDELAHADYGVCAKLSLDGIETPLARGRARRGIIVLAVEVQHFQAETSRKQHAKIQDASRAPT